MAKGDVEVEVKAGSGRGVVGCGRGGGEEGVRVGCKRRGDFERRVSFDDVGSCCRLERASFFAIQFWSDGVFGSAVPRVVKVDGLAEEGQDQAMRRSRWRIGGSRHHHCGHERGSVWTEGDKGK